MTKIKSNLKIIAERKTFSLSLSQNRNIRSGKLKGDKKWKYSSEVQVQVIMQLVRVNTIPVTNCAYLMRWHKLKYNQIHELDDSLLAHYCKFLNATGKKTKGWRSVLLREPWMVQASVTAADTVPQIQEFQLKYLELRKVILWWKYCQ